MDLAVVLVGVFCLLLSVVLWVRKRLTYWKEMGAPYEEPHFIFGNLKGVGIYDHDGQLTERFYRKHKNKGPFVGVYFFLSPVVIPTDLEFVKSILVKDFNYFHDRGIYFNEKDDPLSAHLFTLPGLRWKRLRTKITPAFTSGKMKLMFPIVVEVAQRLEDKISKVAEVGAVMDVKAVMARFTMDSIGTCAFGLASNTLQDESSEFFRVGMSVFDNPRHGTWFLFLLIAFRELAGKLRFKLFRDEVTKFYTSIVRKTVDYRLANNVQRNDYMDILIKLHTGADEGPLTFNELLSHAFVFHSAGFETSSTTLQFCFYELACNPDIQERTRSHILEVLEAHGGELTYEAMVDMKYLDQVICETLRHYPPAGNHFREVTQDYKVPGTEFTLKKGTSVMVPVYAVHHDPEYYPDPLKFNPDNFADENVKARPFAAYMPFGEGPRICIGARFAMMQVKIGVIAGLRRYRYTVSTKTRQPLKLLSKIFLASVEGGIWLNVERIE
ncbi:probable cytochrome P450 6a23 [Hermetia illucens]|uniref:probable cytochrome P450 6a23 n=1 Tax=Hermetia illucens TaxID=343691 RepID=UPI0018CC2601|nr:probable cytochrome P450 6a23 [Hermetia illucens]